MKLIFILWPKPAFLADSDPVLELGWLLD